MCLYPKLIKNPKYKVNKKNGGNIPPMIDPRVAYVPIGCQKCIECKKKLKREWLTRLLEEVKHDNIGTFVTLTLSNESYKYIAEKYNYIDKMKGYALDNQIITKATRLFLENWRAKYKKSIKHWLISELGHNGTENIHLHGILWTKNIDEIKKIWIWGFAWTGYTKDEKIVNYINEKTVNYITKYMMKVDTKNKEYKPIVLTSSGIGNSYTKTHNSKLNKYLENKTKETYICRNGTRTALPIYYRNKIYSEEQREKLWIEKLNKNTRYVLGKKIDISKNEDEYNAILKEAQKLNKELGYSDNNITWEQKEYENMMRQLKNEERIKKAKKN